jgi:hypothetical protein
VAEPGSWRTLNDGSPNEVILAVDFTVTGRPGASFSDLVPKLGQNMTVWESVPPPVSVSAGMSSSDYLDWWLDGCRPSGRRVRAVLGYCVGSSFAAVMAGRIGQWQAQEPHLIVFDPESPVIPSLYRDFLTAIQNLASILSGAELIVAREAASGALLECGDDFTAAGAALTRVYQRASGIAFDRIGLDPELREELIAAFGSYVSYLVAARQIDPVPGLGRAMAITSSMSSSGAGAAAEEIRFDTDHESILGDERVAQAVRDVLGGVSSAT